jgi:exodeoxyribonuclease V alpha subunit
MELLSLEGVIEKVLYRNQTNGYAVLYLECEEQGSIPMTGTLPPIGAGERLSVEGSFVNHPQYGRQFKINSAEVLPPQNEQSLVRYLSSGFIHGLGPVTAGRIVEKFGMETLDIIENEPERLREIRGISPSKARDIAASYKSQANIRDLTAFLQDYGMEPIVAIRLYARFGPFAISAVKENP